MHFFSYLVCFPSLRHQFQAVPTKAAVATVLGPGSLARTRGDVAARLPFVRGEGSLGGGAAPQRLHGRRTGAGEGLFPESRFPSLAGVVVVLPQNVLSFL